MDEKTIQDLAEVKQRAVSNTRRIEVLEQEQRELNDLVTSVAVIAEKQSQMETNIEQIRNDVGTLLGKPGKRWEVLLDTIFKVVITVAVTAALMKLGIGG